MLHKRCDIKTLLDETIKRERLIRDAGNSTDEPWIAADAKVEVLQEIRDAIFDQRLPE